MASDEDVPQESVERKEWFRVARTARGVSTVTVTLQEGNVSVKWSVLGHGNLKTGLAEARMRAAAALDEMLALVTG